MNARRNPRPDNLAGLRVLITTGKYTGCEGVCVGPATDGKRWAINPDGTDDIMQLVFEREFGLVIDLSGDPDAN